MSNWQVVVLIVGCVLAFAYGLWLFGRE